MSDFEAFQTIKQSYSENTGATARQYLSLHEKVMQEQKTHSPQLPQDARKLAVFDLAIADLKADQGDNTAAGIFYKEAQDLMRSRKPQGLSDIAKDVHRKIVG